MPREELIKFWKLSGTYSQYHSVVNTVIGAFCCDWWASCCRTGPLCLSMTAGTMVNTVSIYFTYILLIYNNTAPLRDVTSTSWYLAKKLLVF